MIEHNRGVNHTHYKPLRDITKVEYHPTEKSKE